METEKFDASVAPHLKSNEKSETARKNGNSFFERREYFEALLCYNEALCYAETDEVMAEAYGNRSAVYYSVNNVEKCLENIDLARNHRYSAEKMEKLNERERRCRNLLYHQQETSFENNVKNFFKLSYPPNENVPFVVNCVKLGFEQKYGRGIYATRKLKVGDILAMEEPFAKSFVDETNFKRCFQCFKANKLSLIPCFYASKLKFKTDRKSIN